VSVGACPVYAFGYESAVTVRTLPQARQAARRLQHMGYRSVVITLGKHGAVYTAEHDIVHLPGLEVSVKDTTAAGDTFAGYLASALAIGQALPTALAVANAVAALAVTRAGAQPAIPTRQEVQHFLNTLCVPRSRIPMLYDRLRENSRQI
jgi:ribokinase